MDWNRIEVAGRVTALARGFCAGVDTDGNAFVVPLRLPHSSVRTYDGLLLDSFGVLGVAQGEQTWLTGRGADGRLHLWSAYADGSMFVPHSLEAIGAVWAAPVLDAHAELVLSAHLDDGSWRLRVHQRETAILGGRPQAADLTMATDPDTALAFAFYEREPLVVAGPLGEAGAPRAWSLGRTDAEWRRIHLSPTPTALCSVGTGQLGRHCWVAGHVEGRPVIYQVLPLPFRGLLRTATVEMPPLQLSEDVLAVGERPVVLVDEHERDQPVFVAALSRGNRLCWHDGTEWKAHPAPDGRVRAACSSGGAVHVLIDGAVWSMSDPT
ncbi:MAG TPA: hypothetical protein VH228_01875 [Nocardioides sp.]|jgi:hypothetical protein|nr:hypothetical protein [Nocardioides sp.]